MGGVGVGRRIVRRRPGAILDILRASGRLDPWFLPALSRSRGLLWQDFARTVPCVAHNDPIGEAICPLTGVGLLAANNGSRPLLQTDGVHWWGQFSGSQSLISPANYSCAAAEAICLAVSFRPASTTIRLVLSLGTASIGLARSVGTNTGSPDRYLFTGYGADATAGTATTGDARLIARVLTTTSVAMTVNGSASTNGLSGTLGAVVSRSYYHGTSVDGTFGLLGRYYGGGPARAVTDAESAQLDALLLGLQA